MTATEIKKENVTVEDKNFLSHFRPKTFEIQNKDGARHSAIFSDYRNNRFRRKRFHYLHIHPVRGNNWEERT